MMLQTIQDICSLGERQDYRALLAAAYIEQRLRAEGIDYSTYEYPTAIPICESVRLLVDGAEVAALSCSFTGGRIDTGCEIITSLQSSQNHFSVPNINYNEKSVSISTANYYAAPAFAVSYKDVDRIRNAKRIEGESRVERVEVTAREILVGNMKEPRAIIFSHFDSLFTGAVDNASGTAVMLELLIEQPDLAKENLFVFDGNEELSYDHSVYWGYGYRVFEERFTRQLANAARLCVIDCVGFETPISYTDAESLRVAFPLKRTKEFAPKTEIIAGSIDGLMAFYHSAADTPELITEPHLRGAADEVLRVIEGRPSHS